MNRRTITGIAFILLIVVLASCKKDNPYEEELESIRNYLKSNGIEAEPTESGLYVIELIEGTGDKPLIGDTVEVWYTGRFLNGNIFDSNISSGNVFTFPVGGGYVIEGWDEGITHIKEGGKSLMIIPSALAYGTIGTYGIPGYTPLVFEVKLDKIYPGPSHITQKAYQE